MARKHPKTSILRGIATKCVENFRDQDCPGLLFYLNGELIGNQIPAKDALCGVRMNERVVEFVLCSNAMLEMKFEHDPRDKLKLINTSIVRGKAVGRHHEPEDNSDDDGHDDREYVNNQYTKYK